MAVRKVKPPALAQPDLETHFQSDEVFKNAFEYSAIGMALVSLEGKWLKVNSRVCEIVGYSADELLNLTFQDITHPDDLDLDLKYVQQMIAGEIETYNMEKRYFHKSGKTVWVLLSVSLAKNDDQKPLFFISQIKDITERKLASEKLLESEKRYRNFFDNSPIPMWEEDLSEAKKRVDDLKAQGVTDFRTYFASHPDVVAELASLIKVLDVNQATLNLYGAKNKEELFTDLDTRSAGEIENNPEDFIAIAEGKTSNNWDGADETLSGEPIEISLNWSVVPGHEHDYSKVIVTTIDVTERKRSEQALSASELFAHSTLNALSAHIAVLDKNGIIIAVNQAWREFAKANPPVKTNVMEGANYLAVCDSAKGSGSEGAKEMAAGIRSVMRGDTKEFTFEYPCHASIENRWFNLYVTGFGEAENRQIVVAHENITERIHAQQELQKSEERYKSIVEDMPMMMCRFTADGTLTFINEFYCQYFNKSYEQLLGSNLFNLIPAEEQEAVKQKYFSLNQENPFVTYEYKTVDNDGKVNWQKWTDRALFNEKGEILEYQSVGEDITEQKLAEEKLRKSEEYYRRLTENFPNGIVVICDKDFRFMFLSGGEVERYGINPQKYIGKTFAEVLHPEILQRIKPFMNAALNGEKDSFELPYLYDSYYFVNFSPLQESDGSIKEILIVAQNITEQKQASEIREESEKRYRSLFEDSPISLWEEDFSGVKQKIDELKQAGVKDFEAYFSEHPETVIECASLVKILNVNKASVELYNAESKEDLTTNMLRLLRAESVTEQFTKELVQIANGETHFELEESDSTLSGEPLVVSIAWSVMPGHEEDLSRVIVSIVDITEQKHTEERLRKSEERYKLSSRATFNAIWDWDLATNQVWWNEAFQTHFGYDLSEIESGPESWLSRIHPDDLLRVETQIQEALDSNAHFWSDTYRFRRADGTYAIIEDRGYISRDELGKPLRMIGAMQDITERKQAEEERRVLIEELGERVKELTFLHNISRIFMDNAKPEDEVMQSVVEMMPSAWKYPEVAVARIGFNGSQFTTPNFKQTDWMLSEFFEYPGGNLGVVQVAYLEERPLGDVGPFLEEERSLLVSTAEKLQTYLKGLSADRAINRQLTELETLYESGLEISQLLTPKEIAQKVIGVLERKLNWHHIAIREYDSEANSVKLIGFNKLAVSANEAEEYIQKMNSLISNPSQGLSGWVTTHGKSILLGNVKTDERYVSVFPAIKSGIYVPLKIGEKIIGSIAVESEEENAFTEHDQRLLETLAGQAAIAIENANLFNELEKRVQERTLQIEATKRRLELATHAGQIGVWEYKPRENFAVWDERMHIIHHLPVGAFDGKPETWAKYIHPEDLTKSQIHSQLAFTENLLLNNEHRIILPDGNIRYIATSAVTVFGEDNTPERIIGICRDITERKQIEKNLEESESYARLLFDAAPDPVFVMESDGTMVDVNKFFEMQHQINRESLQGKNISALNLFPPEELRKANEYLMEVVTGKSIPPVELKFYAPDDELHTLELHSYPIEVQGHTLVLSTSRDITTHKKFEEALKLANAEMENALKVKDEFLANMSHELRTPLNAILGISESLEEQMIGKLNEKQQKYVGIIKESGKHLLDLINDILDISKIEAGRMELTFHPIGVEKLCQSSLRMIKELAQKKKIQVSFKIHGEVATIMGDERRLKQVLVNLLSNAVKFTEENNKIGLEVRGYPQRNEVAFSVWDTGIGIAEEDLKFLFKPFVQLDAGLAREFQGTGLGLALVAQMVRLHGGSVSVKSQIGKGSMFTITLPWEAEEQNAPAKVTGELVLPSQKSDEKRKGTILLVEDTDIIVSLVKDYLTYKGYDVIVAYNGREGIYFAKEKRPDLILMDVMMPIMNGIDATLEIRKDKNLSRVPIIALTALAMPGDRERCLQAGMTDYMSKPVQLNELIEIIEKYVTRD